MLPKPEERKAINFAPPSYRESSSPVPEPEPFFVPENNSLQQQERTQEASHEQRNEQERVPSEEEGFLEETIDTLKKKLKRPKKNKYAGSIPQIRDDFTVQIEHIMEDGLKDAFLSMTPVQQQEFKIKGEETAILIRESLQSTKVKVKKIIFLLVDWLRLIPGINVFFVEQEAKIKADKLIALRYHFPSQRK